MDYNKVDVLLIKAGNTKYERPILGLEFLKEYMLKNGVSCSIDNFRDDPKMMIYPKVVGLSGFPEDIYDIKEYSKVIKNANPGIYVIVGGQVSIFHEELLKNEYIDAICWGEGEETLLEYVLAIKNNESTSKIKGIYQRNSNFSKRNPIDINNAVTPLFYGENLNSIVQLSTMRGCNGNCSFCEAKYFNQGLRGMNANTVINWIDKLIKYHKNLSRIQFMDDNFMSDPIRAEKILEYLSENNLKALFLSRADSVVENESIFKDYCKSIEEVSIGIESFSQSQLNRWNKKTTVKDNNKSLSILKNSEICTNSFIILSDAKTTLRELEEQIRGIKNAPPTRYKNHDFPFGLKNYSLFTVLRTKLDGEKTRYYEIMNLEHLFKPHKFLEETEWMMMRAFNASVMNDNDRIIHENNIMANSRMDIYLNGVKYLMEGKEGLFNIEKNLFKRDFYRRAQITPIREPL
ncbi:MAG: radical SAM protein [Candidatus Nanoarchaeia archaeon]|jgi:hypothetical protein